MDSFEIAASGELRPRDYVHTVASHRGSVTQESAGDGLAYYTVVYYCVIRLSEVLRNAPLALYFIETKTFTKRIGDLGLEEELRGLQDDLLRDPAAGVLDGGTGGLRKVRMRDRRRSKGKRGGARVHYLYLDREGLIYLMFVYGKDEQAMLTPRQKKELKVVVDAIKSEWDTRT